MNTIDAAELTYPDKPDKNGYAKRYYKRRAFYFGLHNTPESFLLFGEWKRRLIETGTAPEVKSVRKDLAHQASNSRSDNNSPPDRRTLGWPWISLLCALIVSGTMLGSVKILSSSIGPTVDGVTLTEEEINFIRGIRKHDNTFEQYREINAKKMAELVAKLKEEGPINGKHHTRKGS